MTLHPVHDVRVRLVVGLDLLGWDEERALAFAVAAFGGTLLGTWLAGVLL